MSLDSLLRATGKNLANCGEKANWYSPLSNLTNLTVSDGVVSLPAVLYGSGVAINKNRVFTNGETFTIHANHTSPTGDVPTNQYRFIIKPYKNDNVVKDITITGWTYNQSYKAYYSPGTSKSFTLPKDTVNSFEWGLVFMAYGDISAGTVLTYSNIQIEKGSIATTYEPYEYLGPKTIIIPYRGNNIITYPYENTSQTINGVTFTDNGDGTITANGTADSDAVFWLFNSTKTVSQWGLDSTKNYFFRNLRVSGKDDSGSTMFYAAIQYRMQMLMDTGEGVTLEKPNAQYPLSFKIVVLSGKTVNNVTFYPQLLEKTENNVYEEYSANTGNKEVLKVSYNSRNFFDINTLASSVNITKSITNNTITFTSTAVNGRYVYKIPTEIGKQYTVSVKSLASVPTSGQSATGSDIFLGSTENPDISDYGSITSTSLTKTFTATTKFLYIKQYVCYGANQVGGQKIIEELQVELGNKKTDYVPYFNTTVWTKKA